MFLPSPLLVAVAKLTSTVVFVVSLRDATLLSLVSVKAFFSGVGVSCGEVLLHLDVFHVIKKK